MSYQLRNDETVQENVRRIALEQIDKALAEIDDIELDRHETIHQVRKRCKKLRALVRMVRPALGKTYRKENHAFRDIARDLAGMRDEQSMVEALEGLQKTLDGVERHRFDHVLGKLRARRDAMATSSQHEPEALLAEARKALRTARNRVDQWKLKNEGFKAISGGFQITYKRGRKAFNRAFQSDQASDFHEWRKRVKYHVHHLNLLCPLWPRVNKAWSRETKTLADILGDDHDLSLLDTLLESEGEKLAGDATRKDLQLVIENEQRRLRGMAWEIGQRPHAEKPNALIKRWNRYWVASQ